MSSVEKYYSDNSAKSVDHSLFVDLNAHVLHLGAQYLSDPENIFNLLNSLKSCPAGLLNNIFYSTTLNGEKILSTRSTKAENQQILDDIIDLIEPIYNELVVTPDTHPLLRSALVAEISDIATNKLRFSHLYIFKEITNEINGRLANTELGNKLQNTLDKITAIRDIIYKDCFFLITKAIRDMRDGNQSYTPILSIDYVRKEAHQNCFSFITSAMFRFNIDDDCKFTTLAMSWIVRGIQQTIHDHKGTGFSDKKFTYKFISLNESELFSDETTSEEFVNYLEDNKESVKTSPNCPSNQMILSEHIKGALHSESKETIAIVEYLVAGDVTDEQVRLFLKLDEQEYKAVSDGWFEKIEAYLAIQSKKDLYLAHMYDVPEDDVDILLEFLVGLASKEETSSKLNIAVSNLTNIALLIRGRASTRKH